CNDATCVAVCPVNCIHPTPEERAFGSTEMLHSTSEAAGQRRWLAETIAQTYGPHPWTERLRG
ncbi:hypothetical protein ABZ630_29415, partial [Streptomyces albidoflavus]|uniref:hypothetical protein n=1 Tax=Streptomyces albidoflavus TaxID=1886 RepID=UPI0033FD2835